MQQRIFDLVDQNIMPFNWRDDSKYEIIRQKVLEVVDLASNDKGELPEGFVLAFKELLASIEADTSTGQL